MTFRSNVVLSFAAVKWTSFETSGANHTTQRSVSQHFKTVSFIRVANLKQLCRLRANIWIRCFHNAKQMCHPLHPVGRTTAVWCAIPSIRQAVPQLSEVPSSILKVVPRLKLMCHPPSWRPCHGSGWSAILSILRQCHGSVWCAILNSADRATAQTYVPSSPSCRPCHSSLWCAILSILEAVPRLRLMCHPLHLVGRATAETDVPSSPSCRPCYSWNWCAIFSILQAVTQLTLMCHPLHSEGRATAQTDVPSSPSCRLCHSSDCSSPISHLWGISLIPGHFLRDLWWTKWQWYRSFYQHPLSPVSIIPPILHSYQFV